MQGFYAMPIKSATYGTGTIKGWDGRTITIRFADKNVRFAFPKAFETGEISALNDADKRVIREIIDRWISAVIERKRTYMGKDATNENIRTLAKSLNHSFQNCYSVEFLTEKINQSIAQDKQRQAELAAARAAKAATASSPIPPSENAPLKAAQEHSAVEQASSGSEKPKRKGEIRINFGTATFAIGVILSVLSLCGLILIPIGGATGVNALLFVGLAIFLVVGFIAHCVTNQVSAILFADQDKGAKHIINTICIVISFFPYYLLIFFVSCALFVIRTFAGLLKDNFGSSSSSKKVIQIHDEYANVRTLTKCGSTYVGSTRYDRYRDDIGSYWLSTDGRNFTRDK